MENNEKKEGCNTCKKGLNKNHWLMIIFSGYLLGSSIYGTIKLFELIFN